MSTSISDLDKEALRLVALDRQLAAATMGALRSWAKTKRATGRTYKALMYAGALEVALEQTTVSNSRPKRKPRRRRSTPAS
jgi:hypothetical protein